MQRDGYCRACGRKLLRNTDKAIKIYNRAGQDAQTILCTDCSKQIGELVSPQPKVKMYEEESTT